MPEAAAKLGQALLQTLYRVSHKIIGALLQIMHRAPVVSFIRLFQQINQTLGVADVVGRGQLFQLNLDRFR